MEGSYIVIQEFMCRDLKLSGNELVVYAVVHGFSQDGKSYFYGGAKYISEKYNITERTVYSILDNLTKQGLLLKKTTKVLPTVDRNGDTKVKKAAGSVFYVLYATSCSRAAEKSADNNGSNVESERENPEKKAEANEEKGNALTGFATSPAEKISAAATENSSTVTTEKIAPVTAEKISGNNKFNNKFKNKSSASEKQNSGDLNKSQEAADSITQKLKSLFGGHFVFDSSFSGKLESLRNQHKLTRDEFCEYLEFVKAKTDAKNPDDVAAYFFKLALQDSGIQSFLFAREESKKQESGEQAESKDSQITCPACGTVHSLYKSCPSCNLDYYNIGNKNAISFHRKYFLLPAEKRKHYDDECLELTNSPGLNFRKRNELYSLLLKKYGLYEGAENAD